MNYNKVLVLMLYVLAINVYSCHTVEHIIEEEWVEPNAWERKVTVERKTDYINIPKDHLNKNANSEVVFVYYKKLISYLFGRDNLQYNAGMGHYCRSLVFQVMPTQLTELESVTDPRELDLMLQELVINAHSNHLCENTSNLNSKSTLSFMGLIWDIVKDVWQLLKTSELQVSLIGVLCVILAWWSYCQYGFQGVLSFVILGSLVFGYYITYIECNRNLETEEQLQLLADVDDEVTFFTRIERWFYGSKSEKQHMRERILKSHKFRLPFCRPDHVLLMYGNDIFLKQIQMLIEKCMSTIEVVNNRLQFPLNLVAAMSVIYLIGFIIKLTFKYIINPGAWYGILTATSNVHLPNASTAHKIQQPSESIEDRISGENLKVLLNLMKNSHSQILKDMATNASGVQEVLEQLESPSVGTADETPKTSKTNSPRKSSEEQTYTPNIATPKSSQSNSPQNSHENILAATAEDSPSKILKNSENVENIKQNL